MFEKLAGKGVTLVTATHSAALLPYHSRILRIKGAAAEGGRGWSIKDVEEGAEGEARAEVMLRALLEVARADTTFSRVYVLSNAHLVCHIEEVMPLNLFEDAFLDGPAWDADGVFAEGERGGFASSR